LVHKILWLITFSLYTMAPLAISFNTQGAVVDSHKKPLPPLLTINLFLDNLLSAEEDIQQETSALSDTVIIKKKKGVRRKVKVWGCGSKIIQSHNGSSGRDNGTWKEKTSQNPCLGLKNC